MPFHDVAQKLESMAVTIISKSYILRILKGKGYAKYSFDIVSNERRVFRK